MPNKMKMSKVGTPKRCRNLLENTQRIKIIAVMIIATVKTGPPLCENKKRKSNRSAGGASDKIDL